MSSTFQKKTIKRSTKEIAQNVGRTLLKQIPDKSSIYLMKDLDILELSVKDDVVPITTLDVDVDVDGRGEKQKIKIYHLKNPIVFNSLNDNEKKNLSKFIYSKETKTLNPQKGGKNKKSNIGKKKIYKI